MTFVALAYKNIINITHYESRARKPVELQHFASASDDPPLPPFPPGEGQQCLQSVTNSKCHLLPKSLFNLDPPLGALQLSPAAASLPLLAKLPPRVNRFLEEKQQPAADKVDEEREKHTETESNYLFLDGPILSGALRSSWKENYQPSGSSRAHKVDCSKNAAKEHFSPFVPLVSLSKPPHRKSEPGG